MQIWFYTITIYKLTTLSREKVRLLKKYTLNLQYYYLDGIQARTAKIKKTQYLATFNDNLIFLKKEGFRNI